jgi:hypothetical protein
MSHKRDHWFRICSKDLTAGEANEVYMRTSDPQQFVAALAVARIDDGNDTKILKQV